MDPGRLYALQADALDSWRRANRRGVIEAVTGSGKTRIGIEAIREAIGSDRAALVLVPTKELQDQWYDVVVHAVGSAARVDRLGNGYGGNLRIGQVLIAIVNSARDWPPSATRSLVVADECHHYASPANRTALPDDFEWRLGLTATLERVDGEHERLLRYFGPVCHTIGFRDALSDGIINPFSIGLVGVGMTARERGRYDTANREVRSTYGALIEAAAVRTGTPGEFFRDVNRLARENSEHGRRAFRFKQALLARRRLLAESPTKASVVDRLTPAIRIAERTLIFGQSMDLAEQIAGRLEDKGITADFTHSGLGDDERRLRLRDFETGKTSVLVAPRILDEGVDLPDVDLGVVVSAANSRRQMIQRMGRILRRKEGRLSRLAVLYMEGTVEDPVFGAHEGFLREVIDVADDIGVFREDRLDDAVVFLAITTPKEAPRSPRFDGDPARTPIWVPTPEVTDIVVALGLDVPSAGYQRSEGSAAATSSPHVREALGETRGRCGAGAPDGHARGP